MVASQVVFKRQREISALATLSTDGSKNLWVMIRQKPRGYKTRSFFFGSQALLPAFSFLFFTTHIINGNICFDDIRVGPLFHATGIGQYVFLFPGLCLVLLLFGRPFLMQALPPSFLADTGVVR